jgi:hypothetical protein
MRRRSTSEEEEETPALGGSLNLTQPPGYPRFFENNPESKNRRPDPVL